MKPVAATLLLLTLLGSLTSQECKCRPPEPGAVTRKGYSASILIESKTRYRKPAGVVYLHDVPSENVLVELFPYSKRLWGDTKDRLAACLTDADGHYCFGNIPKGRYQIRASKDGGFQITF